MKDSSLAVVFDWDNTLVDTQDNIFNAIKHTINSMGYSNKAADRNSHESRKSYMVNLFGDQWKKANQIYQQYLDDALLQNIALNQGVEKMLQTLKSHNIYLAIVSNKKNTNLRKEVAYFKLDSYFERVVGSCDTAEDKPSATPLLFALEESTLPINRENVFFVGDSITDVLCAQNANCLPIIYGQSISGYEVAYFKLDSYFERVVGSCDTAEDKPSATPLLFALEESTLPINRENVFFVGDSITDVLCAQNANCLPIIYGQSISGYEDLLCFQHFDKLTDFIIKYLEDR